MVISDRTRRVACLIVASELELSLSNGRLRKWQLVQDLPDSDGEPYGEFDREVCKIIRALRTLARPLSADHYDRQGVA